MYLNVSTSYIPVFTTISTKKIKSWPWVDRVLSASSPDTLLAPLICRGLPAFFFRQWQVPAWARQPTALAFDYLAHWSHKAAAQSKDNDFICSFQITETWCMGGGERGDLQMCFPLDTFSAMSLIKCPWRDR